MTIRSAPPAHTSTGKWTNAVYLDSVLRTLLREEMGLPALVREDEDFKMALWKLREDELVDWEEGRGFPARRLSEWGRRLAAILEAGERLA